jgi:hypothetical protein
MAEKKIGSTKQRAPESFINALLPLKIPSSPDETASSPGKVPKRRRIFLWQKKLQQAALLKSQSGISSIFE